jgi:hypothetical protein
MEAATTKIDGINSARLANPTIQTRLADEACPTVAVAFLQACKHATARRGAGLSIGSEMGTSRDGLKKASKFQRRTQ